MNGTCSTIGVSLLVTALLSGLGVVFAQHMVGPLPQEASSPDPINDDIAAINSTGPFADLETAIAAKGWSADWKIYLRPDLPGPYRLVGPTISIGSGAINHAVVIHRNADGQDVVPIELIGHPDFAQMAMHLETLDGRITGAVLKRDVRARGQEEK